MSDFSKMTPFFANKRFHPRLSLNIFQPTNNQKTHEFAKHMDDTLKQLLANLLMFQEAQRNATNFYQILTFSYPVID